MTILALSGSLRPESSNAALLKAVQRLLPEHVIWNDFKICDLPFFDPQLQFSSEKPALVDDLRQKARAADVIVISTPEYAHGIPGVLKNALEWLVCEETMQKDVVVFIASPSGGQYVREYLLETLKTMDLRASQDRCFVVTSARSDLSSQGEILNPALRDALGEFLKRAFTF